MPAHILIVDDTPLNIKLLSARLIKDYYTVTPAENGFRALELAQREKPDLILLDIMMPEMDGFEVCTRLKADPATAYIPVIMVTALTDSADRVRGLQCGADDFLSKPINEIALMARVRSLLRLKFMMDEWRLREGSSAEAAFSDPANELNNFSGSLVYYLEDNPSLVNLTQNLLSTFQLNFRIFSHPTEFLTATAQKSPDIAIISLDLVNEDALRLVAQLRAKETTRALPILMLSDEGHIEKIAKGLDLGANDYALRPLEENEIIARVRTLLKQKRQYDRLKNNYQKNLEMAIADPLTGAFNRHYFDIQMPKLLTRYGHVHPPLALLSLDLDHFKKVNDTYGHPAGDVVLKELVTRVIHALRPNDIVIRMGGEEFVIIMPETDYRTALSIGERLRATVAASPVIIPNSAISIPMTTSIGVTVTKAKMQDTSADLIERADKALYKAKESGRNRVVGDEGID